MQRKMFAKKLIGAVLSAVFILALVPGTVPAFAQDGEFVAVSAGSGHTMAIKADGSLWTWGWNWDGQLGDGTQTEYNYYLQDDTKNNDKLTPVKIMDGVASVSAGGVHSMAIKTDGSLWAWGEGPLGDGTSVNRISPVKIMDGAASVSAGTLYTMAIKKDGSLWAWGNNLNGQLGDGTTENRLSPVKIMDGVAFVSAGDTHTMAIKTDGTLWAWGSNYWGELGDGAHSEYNNSTAAWTEDRGRLSPYKIMDGVAAVSAGFGYTMAVKTDGSLWAWGNNCNCQLGDGTTESRPSPVKVMDGVAAVSAGLNYTMAIKTDGSLWAWGKNDYGQLGCGTQSIYDVYTFGVVEDFNRVDPVKIMDNAASVSTGSTHAAVIKTDGSLWLWGNNNRGQLGNGMTTNRLIPTRLRDRIIIPDEATAVGKLYALGLFRGVGGNADAQPDFDLGRAPTRTEAVTMLVRLLGKEAEAQNGVWATPFTDVPDWAKPYVGYAYANGLTGGTSPTTFGGGAPVTASQYIAFILRALGYSERTGDFSWDKAWPLSDKLGFTDGRYTAAAQDITRGDVAVISYSALFAAHKDSGKTLLEILVETGAVTQEMASGAALNNPEPPPDVTPVTAEVVGTNGDATGARQAAEVETPDPYADNSDLQGGFGVRLPLTKSGGGGKLSFTVETSAEDTILPTDADGSTYGQNFLYCGFFGKTQNNKDVICDIGLGYAEMTGTGLYCWKPYFIIAVNGVKYQDTKETDGDGGIPLIWYRNGYILGSAINVEVGISASPADPSKSRVLLRTEGDAYHANHYGSGGEKRIIQLTYIDVPKINPPSSWKIVASCAFNEPEDSITSAFVYGVFKDIKVDGSTPDFGVTDRKYGYDVKDYNGISGEYLLQVYKGIG